MSKARDLADGTFDTDTLVVDAGNNRVGIGTASPTQALSVDGRIETINGSDIDMDGSASGQLQIDGAGYAFGIALNAQGANLYTNSAIRDLIFGVDETEVMRVTDENVGIGVSSPSQKLHVATGGTSTAIGYLQLDGGGSSGSVIGQMGIGFRPIAAGSNVHASIEALEDGTGTYNTNLLFKTNNAGTDSAPAERARIDSSGNVGIGTSSPATSYGKVLHIHNDTTTGSNLRLTNSTSGSGTGNGFEIVQIGADDYIINREAGSMIFYTNNSESARIDSSGNLLMGTTTRDIGEPRLVIQASSGGTSRHAMLLKSATAGYDCGLIWNTGTSGTRHLLEFATSATYTVVGSIRSNGSSTSYNTTSDYRLKENIVDLTGASDRVNQIPVHRFNFIADPDTTVDGFLAHEVADIVPEAISGEKDAMRDEEYEVTPAVLDDDGNVVTEAVMGTRQVPDYQGIDQSKLVPLLTAALQEALAKIETLETEMTSVKARLDALETP